MTTPTSLRVVVEGQADAVILRAILGDDLKARIRFYAAQAGGSLITVGRNLLVHEGGPVLVVMDSGALDPQQSSSRALAAYALSSVAPGERCDVFVFDPEIEVVFFEAPRVLDRLLGRQVPPEVIREGSLIPRQTLDKLLGEGTPARDRQSFIAGLDPQAATGLRAGKQAAASHDAVLTLLTPAAKAV
jgi:hypothetical protein